MARGPKTEVEKALAVFLSMAVDPQERVVNVGAVYGAAQAYVHLNQTPKAKLILKKVIEHQWTLDEGEYLEKCWLMLAEIYVNQGKADNATALIQKALSMNASCMKAFELMAYIHEKDQKWVDAAAHYEDAWRICRHRKPAIGFKLAYNYLKCRRFFDCIEVCHKVLHQYPSYPKIKKEVMDKARMNIRT